MNRKQKFAAALAAGAVSVAGAGVAFAYFTSTGSNTTSATVAGEQTDTWGVSFDTPDYSAASDALYPGTHVDFPVTVTNNGDGHQGYTTLSAELKTVGSDATATVADADGNAITDCLASWFTVSVTSPSDVVDLAPLGANSDEVATLTFVNDAAVDQGACQDALPAFTVSVQ